MTVSLSSFAETVEMGETYGRGAMKNSLEGFLENEEMPEGLDRDILKTILEGYEDLNTTAPDLVPSKADDLLGELRNALEGIQAE